MATNSFLQAIENAQIYAGKVVLSLPSLDGEGNGVYKVKGFMEDDLTLNLGNTWGSILPDAQTANQIGQILGAQNQLTWIQASASSWKSTEPLEFEINMYLVTLDYSQNSILEDAKQIMKLMALHVEGDNWATAKIHGGYHVDYTKSNVDLNMINSNFTNTKDLAKNLYKQDAGSTYGNMIGGVIQNLDPYNIGPQGTITMYINNRMKIGNLLLKKCSFSISSSYVSPDVPLYIKMNLAFRSSRALLTTDIDRLMEVGSV